MINACRHKLRMLKNREKNTHACTRSDNDILSFMMYVTTTNKSNPLYGAYCWFVAATRHVLVNGAFTTKSTPWRINAFLRVTGETLVPAEFSWYPVSSILGGAGQKGRVQISASGVSDDLDGKVKFTVTILHPSSIGSVDRVLLNANGLFYGRFVQYFKILQKSV